MANRKELFIVRHGKSSWDMEFVDDIDRSLTERGVRNAYTMGKRLHDRNMVPECIYTSPANRAMHTAIIMARVMEVSEDQIFVKRDLYMANEEEILRVISNTPDTINSLAVFGHNPSFTIFANRFIKKPIDNLPTAGVVIVSFEMASWGELSPEKIIDEHVDCPKKVW